MLSSNLNVPGAQMKPYVDVGPQHFVGSGKKSGYGTQDIIYLIIISHSVYEVNHTSGSQTEGTIYFIIYSYSMYEVNYNHHPFVYGAQGTIYLIVTSYSMHEVYN